eukprot:m51a1_g11320 hypothetical protein (613) ;mRNA; r:113578-116467
MCMSAFVAVSHADRVAALVARAKEDRQQIATLKEQLQREKARADAGDVQRAALEERVRVVLEKVKQDMAQQQTAIRKNSDVDLAGRLERSEQECAELRKRAADQAEQLKSERSLADLQQAVSDLTRRLDAASAAAASKDRECAELKKKVAEMNERLFSKHDSATPTAVSTRERECADLKKKVAELQHSLAQRDAQESASSAKERECADLKKKVAELQGSLALRGAQVGRFPPSADREVSDMKKKVAELQLSLTQRDAQIRKLKEELASERGMVALLQSAVVSPSDSGESSSRDSNPPPAAIATSPAFRGLFSPPVAAINGECSCPGSPVRKGSALSDRLRSSGEFAKPPHKAPSASHTPEPVVRKTPSASRSPEPQPAKPVARGPVHAELCALEEPKVHWYELETQEELQQMEKEIQRFFEPSSEEYVINRLRDSKPPIAFTLTRAWKVTNTVLESWFDKRVEFLKKQGRIQDELAIQTAFHGCSNMKSIDNICKWGLLRVGHPKNPSAGTAEGYFGDNRLGIYLSRYIDYALPYSNTEGRPLELDEAVRVVMFKVIPGRTLQVRQVAPHMKPSEGFDSHTSPKFLEWFLFDETQACPAYVLDIKAVRNLCV